VYRDTGGGLHAFKRGFAWQAFLLPEIWLFVRGLPVDASVWLALAISAVAFLPRPWAGLVVLCGRIAAGLFTWRRLNATYRSKGWTLVADVRARSLVDALSTVQSPIVRPAACGLTCA